MENMLRFEGRRYSDRPAGRLHEVWLFHMFVGHQSSRKTLHPTHLAAALWSRYWREQHLKCAARWQKFNYSPGIAHQIGTNEKLRQSIESGKWCVRIPEEDFSKIVDPKNQSRHLHRAPNKETIRRYRIPRMFEWCWGTSLGCLSKHR